MNNAPPITSHFDSARDVVAHEKSRLEAFDLRQDEIRVETGQIGAENTSRRLRINRGGAHSQQDKDKKSRRDMAFTMLLEQMRKQLDLLEQRMDELHADLEDKYGQDNVISGMAETYLSPDKLAALETDEDKLQALADEFLNPDGTMKDKYKDLKEAQYVHAWREAQLLEATLDKYEHKNGLTFEDKQDIYETAKAVGLAANKNYVLDSAAQEIKSVIDTQLDNMN